MGGWAFHTRGVKTQPALSAKLLKKLSWIVDIYKKKKKIKKKCPCIAMQKMMCVHTKNPINKKFQHYVQVIVAKNIHDVKKTNKSEHSLDEQVCITSFQKDVYNWFLITIFISQLPVLCESLICNQLLFATVWTKNWKLTCLIHETGNWHVS